MSIRLNHAAVAHARSLIRKGAVERSAPWSFSAADGDALLGHPADWKAYGLAHLGLSSAPEGIKARYHYPVVKRDGGSEMVYLSALRAVRVRAAQQGDKAVFNAAGQLLDAAKKKAAALHASAVGVASCSVQLNGTVPNEIRLTPAGRFRARDGRPAEVKAGWNMDAARAARVIAWASAQADDFVIDYDHQTLYTKENGQPAPAAGWWSAANMEWREGDGLYATNVQWTAAAKAAIEGGEWRYFSPVLYYDPNSGDVLAVLMGAVTNFAAIDGLNGLAVRAAAAFDFTHPSQEDNAVDREELIQMLGLSADATDDQITAALSAMQTRAALAAEVTNILQVGEGESVSAAVSALKAQAGTPDPAKYVPLGQFETLKNELVELRGNVTGREVTELVEQGIAGGKLLEVQREWATELGKKDIAALKGYLDKTPEIAALKGTQTGGKAPTDDGAQSGTLTEEQIAICNATGISHEDFMKANQEAK